MTGIGTDPPLLGAAMPLDALDAHLDWLVQDQRDLELQSFVKAEVLLGDWKPMAAQARHQFAGRSGRLGIHGPFRGFPPASKYPGSGALEHSIRASMSVPNSVRFR